MRAGGLGGDPCKNRGVQAKALFRFVSWFSHQAANANRWAVSSNSSTHQSMPYKFAQERFDYSDLSGGRVFYSHPGYPTFPVRLASEIFQRCLALRQANNQSNACVLYDPCCGSAYHLSVLAYLHWPSIREVIASDINENVIVVAKQNLELLSSTGMENRLREIAEMLQRYGKESHKVALASAHTLRDRIVRLTSEHSLKTRVFQANALESTTLSMHLKNAQVDIVFADVPYGQQSHWHDPASDLELTTPIELMLDALQGVLLPTSIVAIVTDKAQKVSHDNYRRVEQFQVGKRRAVILKPAI